MTELEDGREAGDIGRDDADTELPFTLFPASLPGDRPPPSRIFAPDFDAGRLTAAELYEDIVAVVDIAAALNVSRRRVKEWIATRERCGAPKPVRRLINVDLYSLSDWRAWHALFKITRPGA